MASEISNLKKAVKRLIKAEVADSWKGSASVEDHTAIEQELNNAKTNYKAKLRILEVTMDAYAGGHAPDLRGL